jgi:hypothetical protein
MHCAPQPEYILKAIKIFPYRKLDEQVNVSFCINLAYSLAFKFVKDRIYIVRRSQNITLNSQNTGQGNDYAEKSLFNLSAQLFRVTDSPT